MTCFKNVITIITATISFIYEIYSTGASTDTTTPKSEGNLHILPRNHLDVYPTSGMPNPWFLVISGIWEFHRIANVTYFVLAVAQTIFWFKDSSYLAVRSGKT